jgi:hypothetical protein
MRVETELYRDAMNTIVGIMLLAAMALTVAMTR